MLYHLPSPRMPLKQASIYFPLMDLCAYLYHTLANVHFSVGISALFTIKYELEGNCMHYLNPRHLKIPC